MRYATYNTALRNPPSVKPEVAEALRRLPLSGGFDMAQQYRVLTREGLAVYLWDARRLDITAKGKALLKEGV